MTKRVNEWQEELRTELVAPELDLPGVPLVAGEWHVRRGATVRAGDRVLEIVAGEALFDLSAPVAGVLTERTVEVNEPIAVGQVLGTIVAQQE